MRCISKRIDYKSRRDHIRIKFVGDIHLGNAGCDEALLIETMKDVARDPRCYWIGMGDACEWINRRDPRYDPASMAEWLFDARSLQDMAEAERRRAIEILSPAGGRCLAMIEGNHEASILIHSEREVYTSLAEGIGAREVCLGPSGFVRLGFARMGDGVAANVWTLILYLTHGWWGGRLMGSGALNLERITGWVDADVIVAAHDHKRRAFTVERIASRVHDEVEYQQVHAISCGTFLREALYAERKGYRPSDLGCVELSIWPNHREVSVAI